MKQGISGGKLLLGIALFPVFGYVAGSILAANDVPFEQALLIIVLGGSMLAWAWVR